MKKGKKIWNRLLSLLLCLVMVTGVFAGMEMDAEAFKGDTATYIVDCTQEGLTGGHRYEWKQTFWPTQWNSPNIHEQVNV